MNSAYVPNPQPRDSHTSLARSHGHNGPTNPRNKPKLKRTRKRNSRSKGLTGLRDTRRTVRKAGADSPRGGGGQSTRSRRTVWKSQQNHQCCTLKNGRSTSNSCRADGPRCPSGRFAKPLPAKYYWPNGSKRKRSRTRDEHEERPAEPCLVTVCTMTADSPPSTQTAKRARALEGQHHLPFAWSPESTKGLLPNHRWRWNISRRCYAYEFIASNPLNRDSAELSQRARVPTEILQSEAKFGVWGIMIKHKDARGNYTWSPLTNPNPNTSESKKQAAHENPTKIAQKRHENHTSYKRKIDTTMKASIHLEVRFFTNGWKV
jgi:hypothetical protein